MILVFAFFAFAFGASIGSFINVVALRHHTGRSLSGRSRCAFCSATIAWYDLVPVASFLALRGRCRRCRSRLSLRYPAIEVALGLLFVAIAARFGFRAEHLDLMIYYAAIWSIGAAIFLYDLQHKIIPDRFVLIFGMLALLKPLTPFVFSGDPTEAIRYISAGFILAAPFFLIWLLSKGRWMGLGDAKLALVLGWLLGLAAGITAVVLSFWIGAVISVVLLIGSKFVATRSRSGHKPSLSMQSEVPFAPFMLAGALSVFFFEIDPLALMYILGR